MTSMLLLASRREATRSALRERQLRRYHPNAQGKVRALAMQHARVADLATSFPALLFALAVPRAGFDPAAALACVIEGRSLTDATAAAGIPLWLRKLPPEAFTRPITPLPNDDLFRRQIANHLPPSPRLAPIWMRSVATIAEIAHGPAAIWIARELVRAPPRVDPARLRLVSLWAWFSTQPATLGHALIDRRWTPGMQFGSAVTATEAWRTMIGLHLSLGSQPIADMWLRPGSVDGYDFIPLNSTSDIAEEAEAMQNCLRTYGHNLAHDRSRLWSVRRSGQRVATLRVAARFEGPLPGIAELAGIRNAEMPREVWWAARQWLHTHDLLRMEIQHRRWGTAPLDRSTWRAIWRPYWLARRQIPDWLPLAPSHKAFNAL